MSKSVPLYPFSLPLYPAVCKRYLLLAVCKLLLQPDLLCLQLLILRSSCCRGSLAGSQPPLQNLALIAFLCQACFQGLCMGLHKRNMICLQTFTGPLIASQRWSY